MNYEVETTETFQNWFDRLDHLVAFRITARIERVKQGNFGDSKRIDESIFELRFFFGAGYRIYYTIRGNKIIVLLSGGDKSSQKKDIRNTKSILADLE